MVAGLGYVEQPSVPAAAPVDGDGRAGRAAGRGEPCVVGVAVGVLVLAKGDAALPPAVLEVGGRRAVPGRVKKVLVVVGRPALPIAVGVGVAGRPCPLGRVGRVASGAVPAV